MNNKGNELVLYHGSPDKQIVPTYGLGNDKHDYGKGFYLTGSPVLASEWSVCNPIEKNGWVHKFVLDTSELKILDFEKYDILSWLASKHRLQEIPFWYAGGLKTVLMKYGNRPLEVRKPDGI